MRKRKDLLDSVKEKAMEGDGMCKVFITQLYLYYTVSDMDSSNQLGEIFKVLYIDCEEKTYDEIANRFYIDVYTLNRYRQRFNKVAKMLVPVEIFRVIKA